MFLCSGYRLFKYTLFSTGALVGGIVAFYVTYNYLSNEDDAFYISLGVAIAFGAICGVLVVILYYVGIFVAGAALGGIAAWFVLSIINVDYLQEHRYIPVLILIVVAAIFGIIALFIQKWLVLLATPVIGALLITAGIDYFLELGRMMQYAFNVMHHIPDMPDCWYSWSMLGLFGIIIIAGILVQVFVTGRKYDHKKHMRGKYINVYGCCFPLHITTCNGDFNSLNFLKDKCIMSSYTRAPCRITVKPLRTDSLEVDICGIDVILIANQYSRCTVI